MNVKAQLTKKIGGALFSTALAVTTQGSSNLILGALGGIAAGIASNYINDIKFHKFKKFLKESDPSDLNHDLQKLVIKAVEWTIINIQILYKKNGLTKHQLRELNNFTEHLISQMKALNHQLNGSELEIIKAIEKPKDDTSLLNGFGLHTIDFPDIHPENPYGSFFIEQFESNLQLCFGELLKDKSNRAALIAYQRSIYQGLEKGLDQIIQQNEQILNKLQDSPQRKPIEQENRQWSRVKEKVSKTSNKKLTTEFTIAIDNLLLEIKNDTKLLIDITSDIKEELERVKQITLDIAVELRSNWVEKNKVWILSTMVVLAAIISVLIIQVRSAPITMNIAIKTDDIIQLHSEYPKISEEARVRFYFPNQTIEKEITFSNEILIDKLSKELKGHNFKVELLDPYWKLSQDSIKVQKGNQTLTVKPNNELSTVKGKVRSYLENQPIGGIEIEVLNGLKVTTDSNGSFEILVPVELRKLEYTIIIKEQKGFSLQEKDYYPGLEIIIRLEKLQE